MDSSTTYQSSLDAFHALTESGADVLQAVRERVSDECRELIVLDFPSKSLVLRAVAEDDTIQVVCEARKRPVEHLRCVSHDDMWRPLIGQPFGSGWVTINQQGYCDGVLLSFDGLEPGVLVNVMASSLHIHAIAQRTGRVLASENPTHP